MINARIASLREKKVSQELKFHKLHSIVKSLTRERNQLKKENAAWKDLHKTGLASEQKHKAKINDHLHENLKLITKMSNSRRPAEPAGRPSQSTQPRTQPTPRGS
jgi:protein subunit release factor B